MRVLSFRLSGNDYDGDVADAMYRAASPFGFDNVTADLNTPGTVASRHGDRLFIGYAQVSGVAASVELAFDTGAELIGWAGAAALVEPSEPSATNAYRAIREVAQAMAPEPDCTHSALDNCDCYAPTQREGGG